MEVCEQGLSINHDILHIKRTVFPALWIWRGMVGRGGGWGQERL